MPINAIEPNSYGIALSKLLRGGRDALNSPGKLPESVPLVGGQGAGDFLMGKAPEAIEDYAHGFGPLGRGKGLTTQVDSRILDIAGLPFIGAAGVGKYAKMGKEALMAKTLRETPDIGRREFLKDAGTIAAAGTAGLAIPDVVKLAAKGLTKEVAPGVGAAVARSPLIGAFKGLSGWAAKHAEDLGLYWNYGSGGAPIGEHLRAVAAHMTDNAPLYEPELKELAKHGSLHENLLGDIVANETPHMRTDRTGPGQGIWGGADGIESEWRKGYDKVLAGRGFIGEHVTAMEKSPELKKQYDQYFATGKLPKGAPEWLTYIEPVNAPSDTATAKIFQKTMDSWDPKISGYDG